jgi:TIR domain
MKNDRTRVVTMANIFFNYRHDGEDKEKANNIIRGLREHRHSVFTDLGQNWREEIVPILTNCDGVVVLLTSESLKHDLTVLEWSIAYGVSLVYKHLKLIPVVLDEKAKERLPAVFADAGDPIDAIKASNDEQIVKDIDSKITQSLAGSKTMIFISHAHADKDLAEALGGSDHKCVRDTEGVHSVHVRAWVYSAYRRSHGEATEGRDRADEVRPRHHYSTEH